MKSSLPDLTLPLPISNSALHFKTFFFYSAASYYHTSETYVSSSTSCSSTLDSIYWEMINLVHISLSFAKLLQYFGSPGGYL